MRHTKKMMLDPQRLDQLLRPYRFRVLLVDIVTKEIWFVRPSPLRRLYEHLQVVGQGKQGEAVYAVSGIAGVQFFGAIFDSAVGEEDLSLLYALETNRDRHWTIVETVQQAKEWEIRLAEQAHSHCQATAKRMGPALFERLQPILDIVDSYVAKLGNLTEIFDKEYLYASRSSSEERKEADRLVLGASSGRSQGLADDLQLACLVLARFGREVEGHENPFAGKKVHEDPPLRARIFLLADLIHGKRLEYHCS
jgi:hypothetical protein